VRARVSGTAAFAVIVLLAAVAPVLAQALPPPQAVAPPPPPPGFVPPYEITRTVRAAGFDPLAPPLREGTTYVLRANDFRGILMRVVVDARTGAIRDVNRIVPGREMNDPGAYGQVGMMPPYGSPPDEMPPYGIPPEFDGPEMAPSEQGALPRPPFRPSAIRSTTRASGAMIPPLPRPRPAELASRKPIDDDKAQAKPVVAPDVKADAKTDTKSDTKSDAKTDAKSDAKTEAKSESPSTTPPATGAPPRKTPAAVAPLND
jgi:hypothetical protein